MRKGQGEMRELVWALSIAGVMTLLCPPLHAEDRGASESITWVPRPKPAAVSRPTIDFAELYHFGDRGPIPTEKLLSLAGHTVTLVGFMAVLEKPVRGGFYLAPYPAVSDESGAGRGGLPPTSVLVLLEGAGEKTIEPIRGVLEVSGVLEVGNVEAKGETSTVRLLVRSRRQLRFAALPPKSTTRRDR